MQTDAEGTLASFTHILPVLQFPRSRTVTDFTHCVIIIM